MIKQTLLTFLLVVFTLTPSMTALAQSSSLAIPSSTAPLEILEEEPSFAHLTYPLLMQRVLEGSTPLDPSLSSSELGADFVSFIDQEEERLQDLPVSRFQKRAYLSRLTHTARTYTSIPLSLLERLSSFIDSLFIDEPENPILETHTIKHIGIPEHPAQFQAISSPTHIPSFSTVTGYVPKEVSLPTVLLDLIRVSSAEAIDDPYLPVIADLESDEEEIIITPEMEDLALFFKRNPAQIAHFVQNSITYTPYYGAKKGAAGCLIDRHCNDTDTASLMIALSRAAGIPSRYKKGLALMPISSLGGMLGIDEGEEQARSVFVALSTQDIPVFSLFAHNEPLENADLSSETHFLVEWTIPELFYTYDTRGGDLSYNPISLATTTEALREDIPSHINTQWIDVDTLVRPYEKTHYLIAHDIANFDTESFWYDFLMYQGDLGPIEKYKNDIEAATGVDILDTDLHSTYIGVTTTYGIIPPTLPYILAEGHDVNDQNNEILIERWSVLPNDRREKVTISLINPEDDSILFEMPFFGSAIDNVPLTLSYKGETQDDDVIIDSYGGIHATPSELVSLVPHLQTPFTSFTGEEPISIGESVLLRFTVSRGDETLFIDEKFSVAGNDEGIYLTLSSVRPHAIFSSSDETFYSDVLLEGNAELARQYLLKKQEQSRLLSGALDYGFHTRFSRAVVTQNRVLSIEDNVPTTFMFKGLSIDSSSYIADHSRRDHYETHQKDFRLLWTLYGSHYEGALFSQFTGLDAISTVKGLQYAYNDPQEYTIHTINEETPSYTDVVQALSFSENTKTNMLRDIEEGSTIITPQKLVTHGTWEGTLYISLSPEWTGNYAIGEQTQQNGGFTSDPILTTTYCDEICQLEYYKTDGESRFIYADRSVKGVACRITEDVFNAIITNEHVPENAPAFSYWSISHGSPCLVKTKIFGTAPHSFILAVNGAKFSSPNRYDYWVHHQEIQSLFDNQVESFNPRLFYFDSTAGTYTHDRDTFFSSRKISFYEPIQPLGVGDFWTEEGDVHVVIGDRAEYIMEHPTFSPTQSICSLRDYHCYLQGQKESAVISTLGFPTNNESEAAINSRFYGSGYYQNFIGGQLYTKYIPPQPRSAYQNIFFYVPGLISDTFNAQQYCQNNACGTGGVFGFPTHDPVYNNQRNSVFQDFQNGSRIIWDIEHNSVDVLEDVQTIPILRNYTDEQYREDLIEGFVDAFTEQGIYGLAINLGVGLSMDFVVSRAQVQIQKRLGKIATKTTLRYVPYIGWVYAGVTGVLAIEENNPLFEACSTDPDETSEIDRKSPAYYCGKLGANGLGFAVGTAGGPILRNSRLNFLGANTFRGKRGKSKIVNAITTDKELHTVLNSLRHSKYDKRERFFRLMDELDELDELDVRFHRFENIEDRSIELLLKNPSSIDRLLEDETFHTFVKNGKSLKSYHHLLGDTTGGCHIDPVKTGSRTHRIVGAKRPPNPGPNEVYEADVEYIDNLGRIQTRAKTFFPDGWDENKILSTINMAYKDKGDFKINPHKPDSLLYESAVNDLNIQIVIDKNTKKILSVYPL